MDWDRFITDVERGCTGVEHAEYAKVWLALNKSAVNAAIEQRDEARRWARHYRRKFIQSLEEKMKIKELGRLKNDINVF